MSGSIADQSKQVKKYKREYKAMHKKLQVIKKKHKKLLTFNRKNSSTREFRKIQKKLAESESDASLNLSDSDDFGRQKRSYQHERWCVAHKTGKSSGFESILRNRTF